MELDFRPHFWVCRQAMEATPWDAKWTLFGPVEGFTEKQVNELEKQVAAATAEIPKTMTYTATDAEKAARGGRGLARQRPEDAHAANGSRQEWVR